METFYRRLRWAWTPIYHGVDDVDDDDAPDDESQDAEPSAVERISTGSTKDYVAYIDPVYYFGVAVTRGGTQLDGIQLPPDERIVAIVGGASFGDPATIFVCTRLGKGMYATWRRFRRGANRQLVPVQTEGSRSFTHMVPRAQNEDDAFRESTCGQFIVGTPQGPALLRAITDERGERHLQAVHFSTSKVTSDRIASDAQLGFAADGLCISSSTSGDTLTHITARKQDLLARTSVRGPFVQSPDGTRLAFVTRDDRVWLADARGARYEHLPHDAFSAYVERFEGGNESVIVRSKDNERDAWIVRFN